MTHKAKSCKVQARKKEFYRFMRRLAECKVILVKNLSEGVTPETSAKALDEMKAKGITVI